MNNFRSPALISSPAAYNTKIKKKIWKESGLNAMKVLQTSIHKFVNTRLFLKSFVATSIVKFIMLTLKSLRS